jgi:hypothetical protein
VRQTPLSVEWRRAQRPQHVRRTLGLPQSNPCESALRRLPAPAAAPAPASWPACGVITCSCPHLHHTICSPPPALPSVAPCRPRLHTLSAPSVQSTCTVPSDAPLRCRPRPTSRPPTRLTAGYLSSLPYLCSLIAIGPHQPTRDGAHSLTTARSLAPNRIATFSRCPGLISGPPTFSSPHIYLAPSVADRIVSHATPARSHSAPTLPHRRPRSLHDVPRCIHFFARWNWN